MARNSEKAQSMLFRFREAQAADLGILDAGRTRRPPMRAIAEQDNIPACEKWRGQTLKEISRKVSRIQDPALSDYQVRDLNDEINRLMREKHAWEVRIRALGGPNYARLLPGGGGGGGGGGAGGSKIYDEAGREIRGGAGGGAGNNKGYRYFGRARELPGVKELFEAAARAKLDAAGARKDGGNQAGNELRRQVDAAYYGYAPDEEDGALLASEEAKETDAFESLAKAGSGEDGTGCPPPGWEPLPGDAGDGRAWDLPTMDEVQRELVNRRKSRLLEQL